MNKKLLDTTKRKAGTIAVCTALVLTLGASTALAADTTQGANAGFPLLTKAGALKIWDSAIPVGAVKINDGELSGIVHSTLAVKTENGVTQYSTDGGQTWSETAPDGFNVNVNPAGIVSVSSGFFTPAAGQGFLQGILVKVKEDGQAQHSTDGGETWQDGFPEGAAAKTLPSLEALPLQDIELQDGANIVIHGELPVMPVGVAGSFAVKTENGVTQYSTDGGKTWSETIPEEYGVNFTPAGPISVRKL
jgi:Neuraminidase (sialidase)